MGNFISLLLILEASKSRARGTDGCIQCSGTPSLARPCHCPHLHGSGDGGHGSVCGPGCWMCKQAHACVGLTFHFRHFGIFRDMRTFISRLLTIFRKHMLGLSLFPLVLYSFKPQEVYLLVLYTLVIFPSVSVLRFQRKSILCMRFGPETVTHNVVAFFGAKFPQLVENSRTSSLATIPVTIVVITHISVV